MQDINQIVDLIVLADSGTTRGPVWSLQTDDLNINVVVLDPDQEIGEHVNEEVDVLLVGIAGTGDVIVGGDGKRLGPQQLIVVAKGLHRAIRARDERLVYLTCHRRRAALWPV